MSSSTARRAVLLAVLASAACRGPDAPAPVPAPPATASSPASAPAPEPALASAPGPAPASVAPAAGGSVVAEFMRVNRVDRVIDSWVAEMKRQWDEQVAAMKVKPTPGFWEESVAAYDMQAERAALEAAVSAGIGEGEMREDVAWMNASRLGPLSAKLERVSAATAPLQAALADEARRAIARTMGQTAPAAPPMPITQASLPPGDLATLHAFMERLGYGAPEALAPRLMAALRHALSQAPEETWSDPALLAASVRAALGIEGVFAREFTKKEIADFSAELDSPEARRHDELMERLTPLVMSRSQPFTESLQKHVLRRYAKIFNVAWEEHEREKQREAAP